MDSRDKLLLITNREREASFSSLREVKRLLFLASRGYADEEEIIKEKEKSAFHFRRWKALKGRLENENLS